MADGDSEVVIPRPLEGEGPCDFTGDAKSRLVSFDFKSPPTSLRVGFSRAAQEKAEEVARKYLADRGWVHFDEVQKALPVLFMPRKWKVRRGDGSEEDGWRLAPNFRTNWQMNSFRRLRGEPWWRVALEKPDGNRAHVRWSFVHELRELNPGVLPDDIWEMLPVLLPLPAADDEPSDEFLEHYAAAAWRLEAPSEAQLQEYRL